MKKSVVATIACDSLIWYTAASSLVSIPTRSSLGRKPDVPFAMICSSTAGAILQPQPPPWERLVRRGILVSGAFTVTPADKQILPGLPLGPEETPTTVR